MLEIPTIEPARSKTDLIKLKLINPGSMSWDFPQEVGPRVIYLASQYDYPEQNSRDPEVERRRQASIWNQVMEDGATRFTACQVNIGNDFDISERHRIAKEVGDELGHRQSAEFIERVYSRLFGEVMDVVIISTGIRPFDGYNYHDIGYLPG